MCPGHLGLGQTPSLLSLWQIAADGESRRFEDKVPGSDSSVTGRGISIRQGAPHPTGVSDTSSRVTVEVVLSDGPEVPEQERHRTQSRLVDEQPSPPTHSEPIADLVQ